MTGKPHMHDEEEETPLQKHKRECATARWSFFWKSVGAIAGIVISISLPIAALAFSTREAIARQDERITAIEKREEVLREELSEMRADIKFLVQQTREKK